MAKKKTALYIRVSTEAQYEEGYSIDAQKEMLAGYCISRGIKAYEFYIDGGYSGSNIYRPRLEDLISDIEEGKISAVVVYKLDRLSRSQKDTLYLIEDVLIPNGVGFISLNENMDTSTPIGRAMLGIMSAFAQLERETIRERTRMGMRERVKSGLWMGGGRVPFGYDYDKEKGVLVPNKDAETVRRIYSLYLQGYSTLKIAAMLGLKYERLAIQILKRKSNIGVIVYNGEEYEGCHEPIVSKEVYEKAMDLMERRKKDHSKYGKNLLSGFVICGKCGAKMRYQKWSGGRYKIYCYSQDKSKKHLCKNENCDNGKIWADELEKIVLGDLFSLKLDGDSLPEYGEKLRRDTLSVLKETEERLKKQLKRLYELYAEGDDLLLSAIDEKKREAENIREQIAAEAERRARSETLLRNREELSRIERVWHTLSVEAQRAILEELLDKIVITDDVVDIYYTDKIR